MLAGVSALSEPTIALAPLTPRGVAAFGRASLERLVIIQTLVALLAASAVVWVLRDGIFPTVTAAIAHLPAAGKVQGGTLEWGDDSPVLLAEGRILAFSVDLTHEGSVRSPADFQFEFGRNSLRIYALLGMAEVPYPPDTLPANQTDLRPLWGAWVPELLSLAAIGTFLILLTTWTILATVYALPVWLISWFAGRRLGLGGSWKLAGAALMPGALVLSLAMVFYELGGCDQVQLGYAFGLHLIIGWIYLFVSPIFLSPGQPAAKKNPFA